MGECNVYAGLDDEMALMHKCMYLLLTAARDASGSASGGLDVRVIVGILSFMSVWLYDFPKGVSEFFAEGSNLQFVSRMELMDVCAAH